jgi:hypothetical protein
MTTTWTLEEENFLHVALAAIPRITEIIAAFPAEHRVGALEERNVATRGRHGISAVLK